MERVKYNGTIKPNLATNSSARSFIVSVDPNSNNAVSWDKGYHFNDVNTVASGTARWKETNSTADANGYAAFIVGLSASKNGHTASGSATITAGIQIVGNPITINISES